MKKKNSYFMASTIISVISALGSFISFLVFSFISSVADSMGPEYFETAEDYAVFLKMKPMFSLFTIIMIIAFAGAIFTSIVYFIKMNKSSKEIVNSKGIIIAAIIISFLTSGVLVGVVGIVGFNNAQKELETLNQSDGVVEVESNSYVEAGVKLETLNEFKEKGLINEKDYDAQKSKILEDL